MRSPLGHHVMMRLHDRRVIARSGRELRLAARTLLEQGASCGLLAFGVADSHAHALLACDRRAAGAFARRAEITLQHRLGLQSPFEPARIDPVETQRHLVNAFHYVLGQQKHHGLSSDPAHDGSSVVDLLGLRVAAPDLAPRVRAHLPRLDLEDLRTLVNVDRASPVRLDDLPDAVAGAFALGDLLDAAGATRIAARSAAIAAAVQEGADPRAITDVLSVSRDTVRRLRARPVVACDVSAVRLQLRLRARR